MKLYFNKISNSDGFSLASTLAATAIASIVSLGIAYSIGLSMKGMSHQRNFFLVEDTTSLIQGLISDPAYCGLHFAGANVVGALPLVINPAVDLKEVTAAGVLGPTSILKSGTTFENVVTVDSVSLVAKTPLGPKKYLGFLEIKYKVSSGLLSNFTRKIPMLLNLDNTNKIDLCTSAAADAAVGLASFGHIRGAHYGGCKQTQDKDFNITGSSSFAWPMLTCPNAGLDTLPTCAAGYTLVMSTWIQMNKSYAGEIAGPNNITTMINKFNNFLDNDLYHRSFFCAKN